MADKQTLRQVYLEKRLFLSQKELQHRDKLLRHKVLEFLTERSLNAIHTFLPIKKKNEPDTLQIIKQLSVNRSDSVFYVSKTLPEGKLDHYKLEGRTTLELNKWGIPEPVNGKKTELEGLSAILVPLITFDKTGHRIGYGKGYYDRFLLHYPEVLKVGLALGPPLDLIPYAEPTDVKLDYCISPFAEYDFT